MNEEDVRRRNQLEELLNRAQSNMRAVESGSQEHAMYFGMVMAYEAVIEIIPTGDA